MKFTVLDIYPKNKNYRISKDQNGSYGTGNDYGDNIFSKFLKFFVSKNVDCPPLYAAQICGELKSKGHLVKYTQSIQDIDSDSIIILISSIVCHEHEIECLNLIKNQNIKIFAVGPFASNFPQKYVESGSKVIKGEPEMFFKDFDFYKNNFSDLPNIIDKFKIYDINELSYPAWDVILNYQETKMSFLGKGRSAYINSSRGCPYSCFNYCVYPLQQGRQVRYKNADRVLNEMNHCYDKFKIKNFVFRDPVFSINRKNTIELCNKLILNKQKFNICVETHLKNLDCELSTLLKEAGVKIVYVGIESSDKETLDDAKRYSINNDLQIERVKFLEKIGIKVKAMYILGLPKDSIKTFKETVKYAISINSSFSQFSVFTPYPGTPIFKEYEKKLTSKKFIDFNQWKLVFKHNNLSNNDVRKLLGYAYMKYYFRIKWILGRLPKILFN